jgi:hypothetical protein
MGGVSYIYTGPENDEGEVKMWATLGRFKIVYDTGEYYALSHEEYHTIEEAINIADLKMIEFKNGEISNEPYCVVQVKHIMVVSCFSEEEVVK